MHQNEAYKWRPGDQESPGYSPESGPILSCGHLPYCRRSYFRHPKSAGLFTGWLRRQALVKRKKINKKSTHRIARPVIVRYIHRHVLNLNDVEDKNKKKPSQRRGSTRKYCFIVNTYAFGTLVRDNIHRRPAAKVQTDYTDTPKPVRSNRKFVPMLL